MKRIFLVVLAVALTGLGACSTPRYSADLLRTAIQPLSQVVKLAMDAVQSAED